MNEFKLRAECAHDLGLLVQAIPMTEFTFHRHNSMPDVVCLFKTDLSLNEIRKALDSIPDSHVMAETIALVGDYTGLRH